MMRQQSEPNTQLTVAAGVVFAVLLTACIFFLQAYFYESESREKLRKVVAVPPEEQAQAKAQQLEQITAYRWVNEKTGVVAIPIDRAMQLVLKEGVPAKPMPLAKPIPSAKPMPPAKPMAMPAKPSGQPRG